MKRVIVGTVWVLLAGWAAAQQYPPEDFPAQLPTKQQKTTKIPSTDTTFPGDAVGESSSKNTKVDIGPPMGDARAHPHSGIANDALDTRSYNPHKAQKAIEVGDFYFKRDNYRAALSRYQEALQWKPNDVVAMFKSAESLEKLGRLQEARTGYEAYLKLLPDGPRANEARKALSKLPAAVPDAARQQGAANSAPAVGAPNN